MTEHPACAEALAKYRINPGNVGFGRKKDEQFAQMVELACRYDKPVRIGVNWGSLDQDPLARIMDENSRRPQPLDASETMRHAMVTSALESAARAEEVGLAGEKIILSCKVSSVQDLIAIYRELSKRADYCCIRARRALSGPQSPVPFSATCCCRTGAGGLTTPMWTASPAACARCVSTGAKAVSKSTPLNGVSAPG